MKLALVIPCEGQHCKVGYLGIGDMGGQGGMGLIPCFILQNLLDHSDPIILQMELRLPGNSGLCKNCLQKGIQTEEHCTLQRKRKVIKKRENCEN